MASAWVFQKKKQIAKLGEAKAPWSCGWYDLEGKQRSKSFGPGAIGQRKAEAAKAVVENQLATGQYQHDARKQWDGFREEYESRVLAGMELPSRLVILDTLAHFERIISPKKMAAIRTATIDTYIAKRRTEAGRRKGDTVSPATVNKDLRNLKAMLRIANEWGYLPLVPKFRMLREPQKLATYVSPEHFAAMYQACSVAVRPADKNYGPADWWRGVLVTCYMTGWRIGSVLSLRRADVDLESGEAVSRHEDNKGKRDARVVLHPLVVEHLKKVPGFDPCFFPWDHNVRLLYQDFRRIQEAAGIRLDCHEKHEHTPFCFVYGFHDLRRAFATMNADRMSADALQELMQHRSYSTTQKYIRTARQLNQAVAGLFVPDLKPAANQA